MWVDGGFRLSAAHNPTTNNQHPMPFYEFYCPQNHRIYTFFSRSMGLAGKVPRCPDNEAWTLQKRVSRFAVVGRAKEPGEGGDDADLDDPRMMAAMAEMEREMAGMDENNPDPRQMARLMRRMGELTGEPLGDGMEEMLGRMEAGEDPDALEEEFGDLLDDPAPGEDSAGEGEGGRLAAARRLRARLGPPTRDDRVFEMTEWVDG